MNFYKIYTRFGRYLQNKQARHIMAGQNRLVILFCLCRLLDFQVAHQPPQTAHQFVPKIGIQELGRAGAGDNFDAIFAAQLHGFL